MVLSTEYSEAVNARYTFQPLCVSGSVLSSAQALVGQAASQAAMLSQGQSH